MVSQNKIIPIILFYTTLKTKSSFILLFIFIALFFSARVLAQKDTVINGTHYKLDKTKNPEFSKSHKRLIPLDSEFVMNNKRFRYYSKWFTIGGGVQQNVTYERNLGFAGGADLNFHIKRNFFQAGAEITGANVSLVNNYELHAGYGWRYEDKDVHFAFFMGPSFSSGYALVEKDTISEYLRPYNEFGLYSQAEIVKKIAYDVGIGAALFADWNQEQTIIGFRGILYFSGSYKGEKRKRNID